MKPSNEGVIAQDRIPDYGKGKVASMLRQMDHEKSVIGHMYSQVKRDMPKGPEDAGGLFHDFRVDEEYGNSQSQLGLVDRIALMQKEKVNKLQAAADGQIKGMDIDQQLQLMQEILIQGASAEQSANQVVNLIDR